MIFDTSIFEKNDPELAKKVKSFGKYFKGKKVVHLSWIDAKYIVKRSYAIIHELVLFNEINAEHEDKNYYNYYLMLAIKNFRVWNYYKVIRSANMFLDRIPRIRMMRLKRNKIQVTH